MGKSNLFLNLLPLFLRVLYIQIKNNSYIKNIVHNNMNLLRRKM